jgi:hypothetical protein
MWATEKGLTSDIGSKKTKDRKKAKRLVPWRHQSPRQQPRSYGEEEGVAGGR